MFEDLSDLLKAQKQAAWREVARRVAHEIKNPLTPIALSAERIRRHLSAARRPMLLRCKFSIAALRPSPARWKRFARWSTNSRRWPVSLLPSRSPPTSTPSSKTLWPCSMGGWTDIRVHTSLRRRSAEGDGRSRSHQTSAGQPCGQCRGGDARARWCAKSRSRLLWSPAATP